MRGSSVSHERLMRESTDRVQSAQYSDNPNEQLVARRLLESPALFQTWEREHSGLMRGVANSGRIDTQSLLLKKATCRLIHRKALFEFLRDEQVRGSERQHIVASLHPTMDYAQSVTVEHGSYLRSACSFMCTSHVGGNVVRDPGFFDPMTRYQALYAEYFQIFCSTHFRTGSADAELQGELLPLLKYQLKECRAAIMNSQPEMAWLTHEAKLREPTGDTVRLPRLGAVKRKP